MLGALDPAQRETLYDLLQLATDQGGDCSEAVADC